MTEHIENKRKYFAFDVETTGLNSQQCAIVSVAYIILDDELNAIDYEEIYVHPFEDAVIAPQAIEINGYSVEKWDKKGAVNQQELFEKLDNVLMCHTFSGPRTVSKNQIFAKLDKLTPLGYNVSFDLKFLKELFIKNEESADRYLESESICVLKKIKKHDVLNECVQSDGYKLLNTCKRFGVTNDNPHQAMADIRATVEVYKKLREFYENIKEKED